MRDFRPKLMVWRSIAIALALGITMGELHGRSTMQTKHRAELADALAAERRQLKDAFTIREEEYEQRIKDEQTERLAVSAELEEARQNREVIYRTIEREVEAHATDPAYNLSADFRGLYNTAIAGTRTRGAAAPAANEAAERVDAALPGAADD